MNIRIEIKHNMQIAVQFNARLQRNNARKTANLLDGQQTSLWGNNEVNGTIAIGGSAVRVAGVENSCMC